MLQPGHVKHNDLPQCFLNLIARWTFFRASSPLLTFWVWLQHLFQKQVGSTPFISPLLTHLELVWVLQACCTNFDKIVIKINTFLLHSFLWQTFKVPMWYSSLGICGGYGFGLLYLHKRQCLHIISKQVDYLWIHVAIICLATCQLYMLFFVQ